MNRLAETEAFLRVLETGSMTAAAHGLGITPSGVSRQIARLEERLGAQLLVRTTRRIGPTEAGRAFFERCKRIVADLEEAEEAVAATQLRPRGTLRVDMATAFGEEVVAPLLPAFQERYPEVTLHATYNDRVVDIVGEGVDLAIRIASLADSTLIARRLARNRRVVCGSPAYFARKGMPACPLDLAGHDCMVLLTSEGPRDEWRFESTSVEESRPLWVKVAGRYRANSVRTLRGMALGGAGLALLPTYLIGEDLRSGRLVAALGEMLSHDTAINAVYPPSRHLSPKVRCFVDFLVERIGDPESPPWDRT
ncbi:MAG: LysR family transcriptional regulator [Alphaproteobacteria bacterium]|nr:LysR family transcriptional regulator [Alphaproteobacteria bacterium]